MDMQNMQQPEQPADAGIFSPNDPAAIEEPVQGEFTIDAAQVESGIKDNMDETQIANMDRVLQEGQNLLFGEETHYHLMDQMKDSKDVGGDLGNGAFNIMSMLIKGGGNTMPGDIVLPSGMILMARASEFLNESGIAKVTDDDFEEASHIFSVKIMNTYDPEFRNKMQQHSGQAAPAQQPAQPQGETPQAGGGLLNMTGA